MRALVIANCQATSLAQMLSLYCPDITFDLFTVHTTTSQKTKEFLDAKAHLYQIVISFDLSANFVHLDRASLPASFPNARVYFITNLYFAGLHPDLTYIGDLSQRCQGALGDYHSKIALFGFMNHMSASAAVDFFVESVFEKAGYFNEFEQSRKRLKDVDAKSDIGVYDVFTEHLPKMPLLLSVNHPTSAYFYLYAGRIADRLQQDLGIRRQPLLWHPHYYPNLLAASAIFPVYPPIVTRYGLSYKGSYLFKSHDLKTEFGKTYRLPDFVDSEYSAFEKWGRTTLASTARWLDIQKQFQNL